MAINLAHKSITIDVNDRNAPNVVGIVNVNDKATRYLDVTLTASGKKLTFADCTVTATFATDGYLISDAVACTLNSTADVITVPLEDFKSMSGFLAIEIKIANGETQVLNTPLALKVKVTPRLLDKSMISKDSVGTAAEICREVATARGGHNSLEARLDTVDTNLTKKANKSDIDSINSRLQSTETTLKNKANITDMSNGLASKADKSTTLAQLSKLKDDIVDFNDDLSFNKHSVNLLNENDITINNAILTSQGKVTSDNRGFRIYVLKIGSGNTITVSIDQKWFYGVQSDSDKVIVGQMITGVDATTYFDSSAQENATLKTITLSHDYLFLCFFHKEADSTLSLFTSQIMVNNGENALPYEPYNILKEIDVKNLRYESAINLSVFKQAYIKDCELVANEFNPLKFNSAVAQYTAIKLNSNVKSIRAKVKFSGEAFTTLIAENNGGYDVTNVTNSSIHINMNKNMCYIGYFKNKKLTNTVVKHYSVAENTEFTVGFDVDEAMNTITVYLPNGETYSETNSEYISANGCYAMWEHFIIVKSQAFSCNKITKVYAKSSNNEIMWDDFSRLNGAIGIAPTNHVYYQFTHENQDMNNWIF